MPKLTFEDLEKIRDQAQRAMAVREGGAYRAKVNVHMGTCGIAAGARMVMTALMKEIKTRDLHDVLLTSSGCAGLCSQEPMITVELAGRAPVKYVNLNETKVLEIFEKHIQGGSIVEDYALGIGSERTDT
jgi:NADP-reducing hydrogenase subunit HndB